MVTKSSTSKSKKSETSESSNKTKSIKLPTEFIIRPSLVSNDKEIAEVLISPRLIESLDLKVGDFLKISKGLDELILIANTWSINDEESYDLNVILISQHYLNLFGYLFGDRVQLNKCNNQPGYAESVQILYNEDDSIDEGKLKETLIDIGIIYENLRDLDCNQWIIKSINNKLENQLQNLNLDDNSRNSINNNRVNNQPFLIHPKTTNFEIVKTKLPEFILNFGFDKIGGLKSQIKSIKKNIFIPINHPLIFKGFGIEPPRGLLLYGNSGVGKSMLLKSISYEFRNCHIIKINGPSIVSKYLGGTEEKLREYFKEAMKFQPSIILLDEIDSLVPNRNNDDTTEVDSRVVATLLMLLDNLDGSVVVIGATNRINNIDSNLRRPGRFDQEIEIPIPDVDDRFDILNKQFENMNGKHSLTVEEIKSISSKTHGYVGSDLLLLTRESILKCINNSLAKDDYSNDLNGLKVLINDVEESLKEIRPSAMREIILEMPKVKWEDIGGQEVLKRKLQEMVQLPLIASDTFKKLDIKSPKGLLLYGPPGCSKTLTAKALATESGLNFLAIKGPEIFNKYVGESEKKIREIFQKARLSSPSIIFIDEIDAIAVNRDNDESSNVSKQVLNTMLNEIDGIEELKGVIIIGATNRPDAIDPALLRPGRLDRHVYVSPPDENARYQIFDKNTLKFNLTDKEVFLKKLVSMTDGFSGSECVLLCQEAGLCAIMEDNLCSRVEERHFKKAIKDISKNITEEMLLYYKEFGEKYKAI